MRHFVSLKDFSAEQLHELVDLSLDIKNNPQRYENALSGKYVGLIFEKPSLRTKTAFYVGALELGGKAIYYSPEEIQLGRREKISDVAATISTFIDAVVLRTFSHEALLEFVKFSSLPVINALSDLVHPTQILGDLITLKELKNDVKDLKVAYIGDGNNVCHSLIHAFSIIGGNLHIAAPKQYQPDKKIMQEAGIFAKQSCGRITLDNSPQRAAEGADVLYTDVWTSMGQEKEQQKRKKVFKNFQINDAIVSLAKKDCVVMHCLPAHRGEEITESVLNSKHSIVFLQAENRLYAAKAILVWVLKGL